MRRMAGLASGPNSAELSLRRQNIRCGGRLRLLFTVPIQFLLECRDSGRQGQERPSWKSVDRECTGLSVEPRNGLKLCVERRGDQPTDLVDHLKGEKRSSNLSSRRGDPISLPTTREAVVSSNLTPDDGFLLARLTSHRKRTDSRIQ